MSEPNEQPLFALMGDDPIAPHLVVMWACIKNGDTAGALNELNTIVQDYGEEYEQRPASQDVIAHAIAVAEAMEAWQGG